MQIELTEQAGNELQRQAEAAGVGVSEYLEKLVLGSTEPQMRLSDGDIAELEAWQERVRASGSSSGRDGRPWREWIHEGHKY